MRTTTRRMLFGSTLGLLLMGAAVPADAVLILVTTYPQTPDPASVVVPAGGFTTNERAESFVEIQGTPGSSFRLLLSLVALDPAGGPDELIGVRRSFFGPSTLIGPSGVFTATLGIGLLAADLNALNRPEGSVIDLRLTDPELIDLTPQVAPVPEPSTVAGGLACVAAGLGAAWRQRRRKRVVSA